MESIYPPENYGASARFPLKEYFDKFKQVLPSEVPRPVASDSNNENELNYLFAIRDLMGADMNLNELKYLAQTCSADRLTCEGENTADFPMDIPETLNSSTKLPAPFFSSQCENTLAVVKCKNDLETRKSTLQLTLGNKRNYHQKLAFSLPPTPPDLEAGSDFILSVLVYRPFAFRYFHAKNVSEKLRFNHEILALGRNTLSQLRDAIICSADDGLCKEVQSTSDDLRPLANARDKYPSGFIFIDNVFYNDFRSPKSIDYSFPIMEWAKEKKIKDLHAKNMENITLNSLTPRFGYPYLYMHQGDCEHIIVFADAKLIDNDDCLHSQCYPHVLKLNRKTNKMCFMCSVSFAKWICIDSDRFPQNKVFLCTDCCNAYNYSDGEKIGKFKLYPYYEKHVVT